MLRLKRRSHDTVSIVFHEKTRAPKRYLLRGFLYAGALHILFLFLFQIRVQYEDKAVQKEIPSVLLEDNSISILTEPFLEEDFVSQLTQELHLTRNVFLPQPPQYVEVEQDTQKDFLRPTLLPWALSDSLSPSQYSLHAYPIKVTLLGDLRNLSFINDGSELFNKASYETLFATPFFAEAQPRVDFYVEISLETKKITQITCLRELVDKRLHELALLLLRTFRFASLTEKGTVSGGIMLQFSGTYESIEPLLRQS